MSPYVQVQYMIWRPDMNYMIQPDFSAGTEFA
jgi:hypothetical protein